MIKSDVQSSLRLPEDLRDRLSQAAGENGHGIGEEMRRRLEASFKSQPSTEDEKTRRLLTAIDAIAWSLHPSLGLWHEKPEAFTALKAAIDTLLGFYQPADEPRAPFDVRGRIFAVKGGPPEVAGIMFAVHQLVAAGEKL